MEQSVEAIPTYALCYLVNGDPTGLTDEDIAIIDEAVSRRKIYEIIPFSEDNPMSNEPYFSHTPFFGLPAEVEDCIVIFNYTNCDE